MITLDEKRKELEEFFNDFLLFYHNKYKLLFDNLPFIYDMTYDSYDFWGNFLDTNDFDIDWDKVTKSDFFDNKDLIERFFDELGIEFKFDEIIKTGVLQIEYNDKNDLDSFDVDLFPNMYGSVSICDEHIQVLLNNNGLITDSVIWVHEISHYRNETGQEETEERSLLTESLAFAMQFIYTDFLYNNGYQYDAISIMIDDLEALYNNSRDTIPLIRLFMTYIEQGRLDEESYNNRFSDLYDKVVESSHRQLQENDQIFFNSVRYAIAFSLAIFMYQCYKKNNNYLYNIEKLNEMLKGESDISNLLKVIGINHIDFDTFDMFLESFQEMAYELIEKQAYVKGEVKHLCMNK